MTSCRTLLVTLLYTVMIGCSQEPANTQTETEVITPPERLQEKPPTAEQTPTGEQAGIDPEPSPAEQKPLDLALPSGTGGELSAQDFEQQKLPDLFENEKKESTVSVGGGVIRDSEQEDLIESLRGAEVSIKVKTD